MPARDNLVFACVAPHSTLLIPLVSGPEGARATASRTAMAELSRRMEAAQPETIVILETHSMLVDGSISLLDSDRVHGQLGPNFTATPDPEREHYFSLRFDVDRELKQEAGVPAHQRTPCSLSRAPRYMCR